MKKLMQLWIPAAAMVVVLSAAPVVQAEDSGGSGSGGSTTTSSSDTPNSGDSTSDSSATEQENSLAEQRNAAEQERMSKLKDAAEALSHKSAAEQDKEHKLNEHFVTACEQRHATFQERLQNIGKHAQKRVDTLDKIVDRVKAFVTANNLTVPNYDTLLANVQTQRDLLKSLSDQLVTQAATFDCGNGVAEAQNSVQAFRDLLKQEISAFKDYKTAVKALITAVHTAADAAKPQETSNESKQ